MHSSTESNSKRDAIHAVHYLGVKEFRLFLLLVVHFFVNLKIHATIPIDRLY